VQIWTTAVVRNSWTKNSKSLITRFHQDKQRVLNVRNIHYPFVNKTDWLSDWLTAVLYRGILAIPHYRAPVYWQVRWRYWRWLRCLTRESTVCGHVVSTKWSTTRLVTSPSGCWSPSPLIDSSPSAFLSGISSSSSSSQVGLTIAVSLQHLHCHGSVSFFLVEARNSS